MAMEAAMALVNRLLAQAQALAAVTAYLRVAEGGEEVDPALRTQLERVVGLLGTREAFDALSAQERAVVIAFARSYLHQALELMDEPARPSAWSHSDPTILQAQGAASAIVARIIAGAGIGRPGIRILDIGTGTAGLAIAFCEAFPDSTVVGLDPWEPALTLARVNISNAGLERRISLCGLPIQEFDDPDGFDLVWLPSFFLPEVALQDAFTRMHGFLRNAGSIVVGVVEGTEDPLAGAIDAMITVRSGGTVLEPDEAVIRLRSAGFTDVREIERSWQAPLRLVLAQRV
jgi:precorrin-6B methylase 2